MVTLSPPKPCVRAGRREQLLSWPSLHTSTTYASPAELSPTPTEDLVHMFNELRSDLVLLYELKQACTNCEYELQMLRHRHEALARAGVLGGPATPALGLAPTSAESAVPEPGLGTDPTKDTIIDVVGAPLTPNSVRAGMGTSLRRVCVCAVPLPKCLGSPLGPCAEGRRAFRIVSLEVRHRQC